MTTVQIVGYSVESGSKDECVGEIRNVLNSPQRNCAWMACINPHSYAVARKDPRFAEALRSSQWLVPDGVGIVIASRILGRPIVERVTGYDVFEAVMNLLNERHGSVFFLGSTDTTLSLLKKRLATDYPNVSLAGVYSPPFKKEFSESENEAMIDAVVASKADVLWVGMTAPKQERWIAAHRDRLPVQFAGAVGAVFDFYTGQIRRSHPVFQRLGLEWLPRLLKEPRRLWSRMLVSAPIFVRDVVRSAIVEYLSRLGIR